MRGRDPRRQRRHAASSPATIPSHCSIDALDTTSAADGAALRGRRRRRGRRSLDRRSPLRGDARQLLRDRRRRGRGRTCGSTSFPTAASRGCASTARSWSTGRGVARARTRRSISRRSRTAAWCSARATCTSARKDNMIMPGRAANMGDGWETRRRRGPGLRLGDRPARRARRRSRSVEIDTNHFKGNYPDSASLEGCLAPGATLDAISASAAWPEILPQTKLQAAPPAFLREGAARDRTGVARAPEHLSRRRRQPAARLWNLAHGLIAARRSEARRLLRACCGATRWVERMMARRPFGTSTALLSAAAREEWFALADERLARGVQPSSEDRRSRALRAAIRRDARICPSGSRPASTAHREDVLEALAEGNHAYEDASATSSSSARRARARRRCWRCCEPA